MSHVFEAWRNSGAMTRIGVYETLDDALAAGRAHIALAQHEARYGSNVGVVIYSDGRHTHTINPSYAVIEVGKKTPEEEVAS